jgi:hydroxymethylbilane synthase
MNRALHGSSHVPVAAFARLDDDCARLLQRGLVGSAADGRLVRTEVAGASDTAERLGAEAARQLLEAGAGEFL